MSNAARQQITVRLPKSLVDFVDRKAQDEGATRTDVLIDAISCLKARDMEALMAEGCRDRADLDLRIAEENLAIGAESLPEW
jgi:Arc/MetJ-type ribon-helix-helix transcriptional regulator